MDTLNDSPWFRYSPPGLLIRLMESFMSLGDEAHFKGDVNMQKKVDKGLAAIGHHSQGENEWQTIVRGVAARTNSTPEGVETRLAQLRLPRTNQMLARRRQMLPTIAQADQPLRTQEIA
ncbi:MAG: hypothetical protein ACJAUN_000509 [Alcanivorax sp.]